jgi:hypothetical protein
MQHISGFSKPAEPPKHIVWFKKVEAWGAAERTNKMEGENSRLGRPGNCTILTTLPSRIGRRNSKDFTVLHSVHDGKFHHCCIHLS